MKRKLAYFPIPALLFAATLWLTGCGGSTNETASSATSASTTGLEQIWLEEAPERAISVSAARELDPGASVVVTGVIGGVMHPFTEGFASFVLGDDAIVFCNEMGDDDHCATPWDACCEDREVLAKRRAMVQILDSQGLPLEQELRGQQGLVELSEVVVVGEVAPESSAENLIINATGIHVKS